MGNTQTLEKQKYYKWKYDTIIEERNHLRDTAHRFFKVYKEVDEPGWTNNVKNKQIRAELRDEQMRLQSVLRKTFQQAQILQKNLETQDNFINLNRKKLNNMYLQEREMNEEASEINQKVNKEKSIMSNRYSLITRHRKGVIVGRVLTILTLFTILYFTITKLNI
jgi:hypothetical protein